MSDPRNEIGRADEYADLRRHLESQIVLEVVKRVVDVVAALLRRDGAALEHALDAVAVVEGVGRVDHGAVEAVGLEADAGDGVDGVEELQCAAKDAHALEADGGSEGEEAAYRRFCRLRRLAITSNRPSLKTLSWTEEQVTERCTPASSMTTLFWSSRLYLLTFFGS